MPRRNRRRNRGGGRTGGASNDGEDSSRALTGAMASLTVSHALGITPVTGIRALRIPKFAPQMVIAPTVVRWVRLFPAYAATTTSYPINASVVATADSVAYLGSGTFRYGFLTFVAIRAYSTGVTTAENLGINDATTGTDILGQASPGTPARVGYVFPLGVRTSLEATTSSVTHATVNYTGQVYIDVLVKFA